MFLPKMDNVTYRPKGLGNLAREVVTSYIQVDDVYFQLEKEQTQLTLIAAGSARCSITIGRGNAVICKSITFDLCPLHKNYTEKFTTAAASCPAAANAVS